MRKIVISLVLLFSMGLLMASGVFMFEHNHVFSHPCPISASLGGSCPVSNSILAWTLHHLSGLKEFTSSVANLVGFLMPLLILLGFVFLRIPKVLKPHDNIGYRFYVFFSDSFCEIRKRFLFWLSLLNKRAPLFYARACIDC